MTHVNYSPRASEREQRRAIINHAATVALEANDRQYQDALALFGLTFGLCALACSAALLLVGGL